MLVRIPAANGVAAGILMVRRAGPNTSSGPRSNWNSGGKPCWSEYQQRTAVVTEIMMVSRCVVVRVFIPDRLGNCVTKASIVFVIYSSYKEDNPNTVCDCVLAFGHRL